MVYLNFLFILLAGFIAIIAGLSALIGWYTSQLPFIYLFSSVVIPITTALSFIFLGSASIAFAFKWRSFARFFAALAFVIGLCTALEYLFDVNLEINEWLMFTRAKTPLTSIHTAPNTSLCIIFLSMALWMISASKRVLARAPLISLLLSLTFLLALLALWGYLAEIETAYGWGHFTSMSLPSSLVFTLLSLSLWMAVNSLIRRNNRQFILWFPIHLGLGIAIASIYLWLALSAQENKSLEQLSLNEAHHINYAFDQKIVEYQKALTRLAKKWESNPSLSAQEWDQMIQDYIANYPSTTAIVRLNSTLDAIDSHSTDYSNVFLRKMLKDQVEDQLYESETLQGGVFTQNRELFIWIPLYQPRFAGLVLGIFNLKTLIDSILNPFIARQFNIVMSNQQNTYYHQISSSMQEGYIAIPFDDKELGSIEIWPTPQLIYEEKSHLPFLTLIVGLLIAALSFLTSYLFQLTKVRKLDLEKSLTQLNASKKQNETILNSTAEGILELDSANQIKFANQAALHMLGYQKDELLGILFNSLIHSPNVLTLEKYFKRKDGSTFPVEYNSTPIEEQGELRGYTIVFRDMTKRHEAEKEIQKTQNLLKAVLDNANLIIYVKDLSFNYLVVNKFFLELFNLKEELILGKNDYSFLPKFTAEKIRRHDQLALSIKMPITIEEIIPLAEGDRTYISIKFPLFDEKREIYALCGISTDITDRKVTEFKIQEYLHKVQSANAELARVNEELTLSRQAAEQANRAKNNFITHMSHEIRAPLNAIIGLTSLSLKTDLTQKQRECFSWIYLSSKLLNELIHNLLDFSVLETENIQLEIAPIHVEELMKEIEDLLKIKAEEKGLELRIQIDPPSFPQVLADAFRLRQILFNLIYNAIQLTQQGYVLLHVFILNQTEQNVTIRFEVQDTGMGISPEDQNALFEQLSRVNGFNTKKMEGMRFDLAISKQLVDLMNGKMGCNSETGKGSIFWFESTFPLYQKDQMTYFSQQERKELLENKSVLILEEWKINRYILEDYSRNWGMSYQSCTSSEEARHKLEEILAKRQPLDFIFLNYALLASTISTIQEIRKEINPHLALVIFTSGPSNEQEELNIQDLGVIGVLNKPVDPTTLFYLISNHLHSVKNKSSHA